MFTSCIAHKLLSSNCSLRDGLGFSPLKDCFTVKSNFPLDLVPLHKKEEFVRVVGCPGITSGIWSRASVCDWVEPTRLVVTDEEKGEDL